MLHQLLLKHPLKPSNTQNAQGEIALGIFTYITCSPDNMVQCV